MSGGINTILATNPTIYRDEFYDNVDITIDWGDGSWDTITLYNKILAPYDGASHIDCRYYLNGEQVENNVSEIVRYAYETIMQD